MEVGAPRKTVDDQIQGFGGSVLKNQFAKSISDYRI